MRINHDLIRPLFDGPLDIVGDIHGEMQALRDLLRQLGYDAATGEHPAGRRLVFIGDLCDRGEDSPAVLHFVRDLVGRDLAQCLLGNHELNVLRGAEKEGNGWFHETDHDAAGGKFTTARRATDADRATFKDFIADLPIALERADLRLVHAAWDTEAMAELRGATGSALDLYTRHAEAARRTTRESGLEERAAAERRQYGASITDPKASVPLLENLGRLDELCQDTNPIRVVTSGPERLTRQPFYASGKWRMLDRVKWWEDYADEVPVVIGHYWRWASPEARQEFSRGEPDLFAGLAVQDWHGAKRNVYCVDFGVGARYKERDSGRSAFRTRLGALRWPERELVLDDGMLSSGT